LTRTSWKRRLAGTEISNKVQRWLRNFYQSSQLAMFNAPPTAR